MTPRPPAAPSRDGVHVEQFGDVTVRPKPRSWSQRRYYETYDADVMTVWVITADGTHVRYLVAGPLSAGVIIRARRPGEHHLVEWGRDDSAHPEFPAALIERARTAAKKSE